MSHFAISNMFGQSKYGGGIFGPSASAPAVPVLIEPINLQNLLVGSSTAISATTTDSDLDEMKWVINPGPSEIIIGTDSSAPYLQTWNIALSAGTYILVARAVRGAQTTDSTPASVTLIDVPATFSNSIYWLDVDFTTNTGDGTEITAATDQGSGSANTIIKATAGGPIYRATAWGGNPCLEIGSNKALYSTGAGAPVAAFLNGSSANSKEFTVITVWQPKHHLASVAWSFGKSTASSRGLTCRTQSNGYKPEVYGGTSAGAQATTAASTYWDHPVPAVWTFRRSGGGTPVMTTRQDGGAIGSNVSWPWTGNHDTDSFGVGVQHNPSPVFGNAAYVTDVIVFNKSLSDAEVAEWELYLGLRRSFVHKLVSTTDDWLVIPALGQSNEVGFCPASSDYSFEASDTYYMGIDGFTRSIVCRDGGGSNDASAVLAFQSDASVGASSHAAIAERLRALGETRKILFVPCALISTDSVAWKTNLTTSPPTTNDLIGYAKHRVRDALKAPGASMFVLIDQGEANCDNSTEAAAWDPDWDLICNELNTYFTGTFDKTIHFIAGRLSVNISGVGGFAANVRAAQDAWVAARSDALLPQRPDGTCEASPGLHLTGTEQQAYGVIRANSWNGAS